jgi:hypothetical protein
MTPEPPYKLPFGKHKGAAISEVPGGYLDWLADPERIETWYPDTRDAIKREVERRKQAVPEAGEAVTIDAEALIVAGARALRQKYAGDVEAQRTIARVAGQVRALLAPPTPTPRWLDTEPTAEVPF